MLIRTQDKKALINTEQVQIVYVAGNLVKCNLRDCSPILGQYSTEEKALKVLDMIQETYSSCITGYSIDGLLEHITDIPNKLFQMPQEEEKTNE